MNKESEDRLLELLADKAIFGLDPDETMEFEKLGRKFPKVAQDESFELAAASMQLATLDASHEMPDFLKNRISDEADDIWRETFGNSEKATVTESVSEEFDEPKTWFIQWLGWAVAGVACIALIANIWSAGIGTQQVAVDPKTGDDPGKIEVNEPTVKEKRELLLASASKIQSKWESPQKDITLEGDVVWSDEKQEGYMTFRGLPVNDKSKETYQLWIFDETQKEATPIDGGIFDVNEQGEAIVPIDANLRVKGPKAFAVTVEKPGGVMVSDREKIVALAKVAA